MGNKHIVESLIEANKKISQIIDKTQNEEEFKLNRQTWIDDLNAIIRQLDHLVEDLEKNT
jgi:hypothetical protein